MTRKADKMTLIIRCAYCDKPCGELDTPVRITELNECPTGLDNCYWLIHGYGNLDVNGSLHQRPGVLCFSCMEHYKEVEILLPRLRHELTLKMT